MEFSTQEEDQQIENLNSVAEMEAISKQDRISDLPDSLIQHILSFLPTTRDAVRSAVLSKRWRRQWTHLPLLIFEPSGDNYFKFIQDTLSLHECPRITKFHLSFSDLDPQITSTIFFAATKCVEDLSLFNFYYNRPYLLPKFLIQSKSLVRLELYKCYIKSKWTVNLPSLKSLKMGCRRSSNNRAIGNIVSGCPVLEWFELSGDLDDPVAVVSTSLRVFSVSRLKIDSSIKVTCPNLVEFNMEGSMIPDQMIENLLLGCPCIHSLKLDHCHMFRWINLVISSNSLKVLHLNLHADITISSCPNLVELDISCCRDSYLMTVNLPSLVRATLDLSGWELGEPYVENELLELFQHLSVLTIQRSLLEIMAAIELRDRPPLPPLNSKILTLYIGLSIGFALPGIAHALGSPKLETLVIKLNSQYHEELLKFYNLESISGRLDYWNSKRSTSFACLESHLETVEIIGLYEADNNCKIGLELIEFLLMKARVLKKMTVALEKPSKDFVIEFSRKLESFPRYSQCANVELLYST